MTTPSQESDPARAFAPIAWVDGEVLPAAAARVPLQDRGFLFGEAVYEGLLTRGGRMVARDAHLERLERSAEGVGLEPARFLDDVRRAIDALTTQEPGLAFLYVQVTGGAGPRDHLPPEPFPPAVYATLSPFDRDALSALQGRGLGIATEPDPRWGLATFKTTQLLANILGKRRARERGAQEIVFFDGEQGLLEGGSTNVFVVREGRARTASVHKNLLPGITRRLLLEHCGDRVSEGDVTRADLESADEVFIASTSRPVVGVTRVDGVPVGDGTPGPVTRGLAADLWQVMESDLG